MSNPATLRIIGAALVGISAGILIGALITANHYTHDDKQLKFGIAIGTEATGIALKDFLLKVKAQDYKPVTNWPAIVDYFANQFIQIGRADQARLK